jgi:hypothetical protein
MVELLTWINADDPDLIPIKIDILDVIQRTYQQYGLDPPNTPPKIGEVDGHERRKEDQYFRREVVPERLKLLEKKLRQKYREEKSSREGYSRVEQRIINAFWDELDSKRDDYKYEINWIAQMWRYRLLGKWFMNNGIATYMTGPNHFTLNWWTMKDGTKPDYRDRDRRWFLAQQFAFTDTKTFKDMDGNGYAIKNEAGEYDMVEYGSRVCYGTINSKPRRVGDTTKSCSMEVEYATRTDMAQLGNQAMDDTSAERVFSTYILQPANKLPIFFRPLQEKLDARNQIRFVSPDPDLMLDTTIDYADSKFSNAYDGATLKWYYGDEVGKIKDVKITERHKTVKLCTSERDVVKGFMIYTTTIEQMSLVGGKDFLKLSRDSLYHQRGINGQTKSGMYVVFFNAADGHPEFIDKYGMSVIGTPTEEQAKQIKNKMGIGAWEYLMRTRRLLTGEQLAHEKRQNPLFYRECFTPPVQNVFFKLEILEERLGDLRFGSDSAVQGNFVWENERFGKVTWIPDKNGRWFLSKTFKEDEANRWVVKDGSKRPYNADKYVSSADPFRIEKTEGGKMSKGGYCCRWKRDLEIDPDDKPVEQWISARSIITYNFRPDTVDEFCEDCLKADIYTGSMNYPERNYDIIQRKYIEWGFSGYLLYGTDPLTGKLNNNAGFYTQQNTQKEMFNLIGTDISLHGKRWRHIDEIEECLEIKNTDDITNHDLFTAKAGTLLAERSQHGTYIDKENKNKPFDTGGWVPLRNY